MRDLIKKHGIGGLIGLLIGGGAMFGGLQEDNELLQQQLADAQEDKIAVLAQYVYAQARLGEIPTLDLAVASSEEMSSAYVAAVHTYDAPVTENLFEGLVQDTQADGISCNPKPAELEPVPVEFP